MNDTTKAACIGGMFSVALLAAYVVFGVLSAVDRQAIYRDGLAAMYVPMALCVFAIPGATVGVLVQFVRKRYRHRYHRYRRRYRWPRG